MACLAIFGRGPLAGGLGPVHIATLRANPQILADIYDLAGIVVLIPFAHGAVNFRHGAAGAADQAFVCPDALCRRVLPVYVAQLDHNVAQANLVAPAFGLGHMGPAHIDGRNLVHRVGTHTNQHRNHAFNPPVGFGAAPVVGAGSGFAVYYTFGNDTFDLVMEMGGNGWHMTVPRANAMQLHWLIRSRFTLVASPMHANCFDFVPIPGAPALGPAITRLSPVALANYAGNAVPQADLANFQLMCGPCNAAKNAGGVPLNLVTLF